MPALAIAIIGGVFGCIVCGVLVSSKRIGFKKMLIYIQFANITAFVAVTLSMWFTKNLYILGACIALYGTLNCPINSISCEMACNSCFPIGGGLVAGI